MYSTQAFERIACSFNSTLPNLVRENDSLSALFGLSQVVPALLTSVSIENLDKLDSTKKQELSNACMLMTYFIHKLDTTHNLNLKESMTRLQVPEV